MDNRRIEHRQKSFLGAVIAFNRRFSTYDCIVRNISEHGAFVTVSEAERLPDQFDLEIEALGVMARAEVAWRASGRLGLRLTPRSFESRCEASPLESLDVASLIRRVRILEDENERLRNRVRELTEAGI